MCLNSLRTKGVSFLSHEGMFNPLLPLLCGGVCLRKCIPNKTPLNRGTSTIPFNIFLMRKLLPTLPLLNGGFFFYVWGLFEKAHTCARGKFAQAQ